MSKKEIIGDITRILADEERYAQRLEERGEFGLAKLAWAAIGEIKAALRSVATADEAVYAERLDAALHERRSAYTCCWDDEDGIGTSTFTRVLDMVE